MYSLRKVPPIEDRIEKRFKHNNGGHRGGAGICAYLDAPISVRAYRAISGFSTNKSLQRTALLS